LALITTDTKEDKNHEERPHAFSFGGSRLGVARIFFAALSVRGEIGSKVKQAVPAFDAAGDALADDEPVTRKSHLGRFLPGCFRGVNKTRALTGLDLVTEFDRGFE